VLTLNLLSLAAFATVIAIGAIFRSLPAAATGILLTLMFGIQSVYLVRIGKDRWEALREHSRGAR